MAIDYMEMGISKGINLGIGALSGYLTKADMTATVKPTTFLGKKSNMLALGASVVGLGIEVLAPKQAKYGEPIAASGFTLLGRSLYFELMAKDFNTANPGISEFPASMTMVPHARRAARNYVPEFEGVNAT